MPHIAHLFLIALENEDAEGTFGPEPPAPYLGMTMRDSGAFIPNYYGIGHRSLDNYIALISGQPPNVETQADCPVFSEMTPGIIGSDGVAVGQGCVLPSGVRTVANQLEESGHSWRAYMQDMGNAVGSGEPATCRHPEIGQPDTTQSARADDQYAVRHNPFVYFHAIVDSPSCDANVVDLSRLPDDLASAATTPEYAFVTPDLCADGHDETCADGTSPGGFAGIDAFLREWVPRIEASHAYRDHGAILTIFDESAFSAGSCCGETTGPNTIDNGGPIPGTGGGRVGAVMVSPCIAPGTVSEAPYNHYSLLRWVEDNFGLPRLANAAADGPVGFGADVFSRPDCLSGETSGNGSPIPPGGETSAQGSNGRRVRLLVRPRRVRPGRWREFRFRVLGAGSSCRQGATLRFAGHRAQTDRHGRARIRARLHRGHRPRRALARTVGCGRAGARVHVTRPRKPGPNAR